MQFAINTPNFGQYGDARVLAELAHEAEEAGWDAFFIWDHIGSGPDWLTPFADPWIALTAMALSTKRIKIGPIVTPMPRRRPWKVARESVTLDHLSQGRLIMGVGIGGDWGREYSCFGEATDTKQHGEMLDEGLDVLTRLWSGETFSYPGKHYQLTNAQFLPKPVQQPRIPIWASGVWPNKKPFRRAAQWDGICPIRHNSEEVTPQDFQDIIAYMKEYRSSDAPPMAIVASGHTTGTDKQKDQATIRAFSEAGVNWWQEGFDWNYSLMQVRTRIRQGPPTI